MISQMYFRGLPIKFWQWYARYQAKPCPVEGHDMASAHTVKELVQCALKKGIIEGSEVPEDLK